MKYRIENKKYDYFVGSYSHGLGESSHIHTHMEMIYLLAGKSGCYVDGKSYDLEAGDLFVVFPNQIHYYRNLVRPLKHYLIIFSPAMDVYLRKFLEKKLPACSVVRKEQMPENTAQVLKEIVDNRKGDAFQQLSAKGQFLHFLGQVLPLIPCSDLPCAFEDDSVKDVLAYCMEHYTEPITLKQIAAERHLSKYYVSHIFKDRTNVTFTRFVNGLRVDRARELLLKKDVNITEVAFDSGFSSIRTFNRVFLEIAGMSPRDFIKHNK